MNQFKALYLLSKFLIFLITIAIFVKRKVSQPTGEIVLTSIVLAVPNHYAC